MKHLTGIFDSGLGGLSAAAEFEKLFPGKRYIYFGDTARVPYGPKSTETIKRYAGQDCRFLISRGASLIIAACGTVSANAIGHLRQTFGIPIIGVVEPSVKKAVGLAAAGCGKITVLGTAATVRSGAYEKAIARLDKSIRVRSVPCPMFVPLVENGYAESEAAEFFAREYLAQAAKDKADAVILGCTHYPYLKGVIGRRLPLSVLVDSGAEAAAEAARFVKRDEAEDGEGQFFVSDCPEDFAKNAKLFLGTTKAITATKIDIEEF